jgi:flagellar M-ring protein FliF
MSVVIQFFKELGPVRLVMSFLALLLFILFFVFFIYKISSKNLVVLYSSLELQDSNKIVEELEARNITYELSSGGATIKVPEDQVLKLRVAMAESGVPGKGSIVGYEIFDKEESLGSTSFLQNVKMLRALEGELIRTIESLEQVDKARVHLVIPRKELFSKERQEPKASIVLKLKNSSNISKQQIESISNLVASSVPELDLSNITIVDTKGKSLKLASKENDTSGFSSNNDERKIATENKFKRVIEELLEKTLGAGKVIAQVNLDMNFDRIVENSEVYDPNNQVLRSQQTIEENEKTPMGSGDDADVSVANNIGGGTDGSDSSGFASISRTDDTRNFEISKVITNKIKDSGAIEKISVAVLVDGIYTSNEQGESQYQPRPEDEIKKIENIVKVAVGFSENRNDQIQVINMPFVNEMNQMEEEEFEDWIKDQLPGIVQTLVLAAVVVLIFVVVIRPIAIRVFDIKKNEAGIDTSLQDQLSFGGKAGSGQLAAEEQDPIINISKMPIPQSTPSPVLSRVNDTVQQLPQETIVLLRRWLNEDSK